MERGGQKERGEASLALFGTWGASKGALPRKNPLSQSVRQKKSVSEGVSEGG